MRAVTVEPAADRGDPPVVDGDVAGEAVGARAVDDRPAPDHQVVCHPHASSESTAVEAEWANVCCRPWPTHCRNLAAGSYAGGLPSPRHERGVAQFQDIVRAAITAKERLASK